MLRTRGVLPTGFECGVLNGAVKPGDTVVIVGAGPVGLAALLTAQLYSPGELIMIDIDEEMMKAYDTFGDAAKEKALKVIIRAP